MKIQISDFQPLAAGTRLGLFTAYFEALGLSIRRLELHVFKEGAELRWWVAGPTAPYINANGQPKKYPYLCWRTRGKSDGFQEAALTLLAGLHPDLGIDPTKRAF